MALCQADTGGERLGSAQVTSGLAVGAWAREGGGLLRLYQVEVYGVDFGHTEEVEPTALTADWMDWVWGRGEEEGMEDLTWKVPGCALVKM